MLAIPAHANPLRYQVVTQTNVATTSPAFMTPGTATSTLVYDAFAQGQTTAPDRVVLLTQLTGSSTNTVLNVGVEYSQGVAGIDCTVTPTSCDWYVDNQVLFQNGTSSQPFSMNLANSYTWKFASSTQGGAGVSGASADRQMKTLTIPQVARYTRIIYSITGTNGAVWGQVVANKQSN